MDLIFLGYALLRKKWVIIICTLAGIGAGFLFTLTKKKLYLSAAQYSTGFTMKNSVRIGSDEGLNVFEVDQRFKNVIETFKSPVVICMVSYDLMLHDLEDKRPFRVLTPELRSKPEYQNVAKNLEKAKAILYKKKQDKDILKAYDPEENKIYELIRLYEYDNESILDKLIVDRVAGTDYLNILYRSENPEMSAFVVNNIGKEFITFYNFINGGRTGESLDKLAQLAKDKKDSIDAKTQKLRGFKKEIGTPDVGDRAKSAMAILQERLSSQTEERSKLNELEGELASVQTQLRSLAPAGAASNNSSNSEIVMLRQRNRELITEKNGTNDVEIQRQIDANFRRMAELSTNSGSGTDDRQDTKRRRDLLMAQQIGLENQIKAQKANVAAIDRDIVKYQAMSTSGSGEDVVVASMQEEIDLANSQYKEMLTGLQSSQNIDVAPDINFRQTFLGQPAIKPEATHRKVIIAMGAFAALLISCLIVIILDFIDHSLRAPSIFSKTVNIKLLSVLNKIDLSNKQLGDYFAVTDSVRSAEGDLYLESMRKLRYEIEASGKKILLVTSTKPEEGKSTVIESLAHTFSLGKKRVLLIDANFSNNRLTEKFEAKPVLDQFSLSGDKPMTADRLGSLISMTNIPNVDIIGCKEGNFSPSEILPKNNLLENLPQLLTSYDFILLEGAALNNHADSKELSKYIEGIVAVFSARSVVKQVDKDSINFLKSDKNRLVGAVLNNVEEDNFEL